MRRTLFKMLEKSQHSSFFQAELSDYRIHSPFSSIEMVQSNESYGTNSYRLSFTFASLFLSFTFGFLFGSGFRQSTSPSFLILSSSALSPKSKPIIPEISFDGYNSTHLWSMAVADENYLRLARLIPCRTVVYTGGPTNDSVNTCDHSSTNEYSLENSLKAQKWLYEHQHPTNCSNKRFAIIEKFAWSGFGSTVHQIVWAFGMALAEDRIAVYRRPGDWVSVDVRNDADLKFFVL